MGLLSPLARMIRLSVQLILMLSLSVLYVLGLALLILLNCVLRPRRVLSHYATCHLDDEEEKWGVMIHGVTWTRAGGQTLVADGGSYITATADRVNMTMTAMLLGADPNLDLYVAFKSTENKILDVNIEDLKGEYKCIDVSSAITERGTLIFAKFISAVYLRKQHDLAKFRVRIMGVFLVGCLVNLAILLFRFWDRLCG